MIVDAQHRQLSSEMPDEFSSSGIFRYALGVEYRGTHYCGWQRQNEVIDNSTTPSIQSRVEQALSRIADEEILITCAGRTDRGVHAREQVVHFDTRSVRPDKAWVFGVNTHLPTDISVRWVRAVAPDFHARFSALARTYRYVVNNQPIRTAITHDLMTPVWKRLDHNVMHHAAQCLLGEHDFSSFRGSTCQSKTPFRFVYHINISRSRNLLVLEIKANAFLQHMVRNIVGVLLKVGAGEKSPEWVEQVLVAKDRRAADITAPAKGLYLTKVDYPVQFGLTKMGLDTLAGIGDFEGIVAGDFC